VVVVLILQVLLVQVEQVIDLMFTAQFRVIMVVLLGISRHHILMGAVGAELLALVEMADPLDQHHYMELVVLAFHHL
jgi:hypothetical protein